MPRCNKYLIGPLQQYELLFQVVESNNETECDCVRSEGHDQLARDCVHALYTYSNTLCVHAKRK